jgi:hypothetical protein
MIFEQESSPNPCGGTGTAHAQAAQRRHREQKARQVAPGLAIGSHREPPPASKWVSDSRGINQSSERELDPKTLARLAAIDAGLAVFETHKDNLLVNLLSAYKGGRKSVPFDADREWDSLRGIARLHFESKWLKQEEPRSSDRKKRLRKFTKFLHEACRWFDEAKQLPLSYDIYLGVRKLNIRAKEISLCARYTNHRHRKQKQGCKRFLSLVVVEPLKESQSQVKRAQALFFF